MAQAAFQQLAKLAVRDPACVREVLPYLTESAYKVVLQKAIPVQIRRLVLYISIIKDKLTDLCGN